MYLFPFSQANNRSDFVLPGSFTDPRPTRPTREEILLDLAQLNEQFSSSPNTSGVVLRNTGGSSNSRPSSLLLELETLEEDESTPSPSPFRKNPATLFDFQEAPRGSSDGTVSPLSEDLRERSGSADTLTYEDPLTPTPTGEDLSTPPAESNEMESISHEGNLIDLTFEKKNNVKSSIGLTLRGLDDPLDDDEEDELSSLLTQPLEEKAPLERQEDGNVERVDEEQHSSQGNSNASSREDLLSSCEGDDLNVNSLDSLGDLKMGQVICVGDKKTGRIRYIGPTEFAPGVWIGVELDTPSGEKLIVHTV